MIHNTGTTAGTSAAALTVDGAQPIWMTLNEARERAFTGEIVFETNPEVLAYLDHGVVYYAERVTDASLGRRLLDAGVLDVGQLDRGTVRVGDIEHLGRLFDRDPSVDRDAVVVVAETATEELVAEMANGVIASARVTAYRHHPSGVHRWFVAPLDPSVVKRPVSAVAQLDSTVVDQLPALPLVDTDELTIEWDDQIDDRSEVAVTNGFDETLLEVAHEPAVEELIADEFDAEALELSLDLAEFEDVAPFDGMAEAAVVQAAADEELVLSLDELVDVDIADDATIESSDDFEFAVVWPDGSEVPAAGAQPALSPTDVDAEEPVVRESDDGNLAFTMPPLELSDDLEQADGDVPDDVAEAVRRAIAAIESATVAAAPAAPVAADVTAQLPLVTDAEPVEQADRVPATAGPQTSAEDVANADRVAAAPGFGGFAPPTMATRAEVLYGQMTDDGQIIDEPAVAPKLPGTSAGGGVASVVFVDEPEEPTAGGGDNERSSALRRLIGSLRRKDH